MHIYITLSKDAIVKWYPFLFTSRGSDFLTGQTMCLFLYNQRVYRLLAGKITIAGQRYPELERVFRCHSPKKRPPSFFSPNYLALGNLSSSVRASAVGRGTGKPRAPRLSDPLASFIMQRAQLPCIHAHCSCISPSLLRY